MRKKSKPELLDYFISWAAVLIGGLLIIGGIAASTPNAGTPIAGGVIIGPWLISRKLNGSNSS